MGFEMSTFDSSLIPSALATGGLSVKLSQLTMKQLIDLSTQIESALKSFNLANPVKMTNLKVTKNSKDSRYLDLDFSLTLLRAPEPIVAAAPDANKKKDSKKGDE